MTRKTRSFSLRAALLGATLLALAACGSSKNPMDVDSIDQRAVERWQYLIDGKAELAWDYLTPGLRIKTPRDDYAAQMNNRPVRWKAVEYEGKDCDEDRCTVRLDITYGLRVPQTGRAEIESSKLQKETWLRTDEGWFYYADP